MFQKTLTSIENVSIYPIISLVIFFAIFVVVIIWTFRKGNPYMEKLSNIPLDNNYEVKINEENKK